MEQPEGKVKDFWRCKSHDPQKSRWRRPPDDPCPDRKDARPTEQEVGDALEKNRNDLVEALAEMKRGENGNG